MIVTGVREKILDVAEELFAEHGFEGTSVRQLAGKAKVNIAMISYYFGSKEKLFEALIEDRASVIRHKIHELNIEDGSSWKKLDTVIEYFVNRFFEKHHFYRILRRETGNVHSSKLTEMISNVMIKNATELKQLLNDGISKKEFRKIDIEMMMASFIGTLWHVIGSYRLTCKVLGLKPERTGVPNEEVKQRLKNHLKDLFHSHLQPKLK